MNFDINDTLLGKQASNPERYDASLLFRIPRSENREKYGISEFSLPFVGVDVWNCYEFSFLTKNGFPVSRIIKLIYPADSPYLVESKSLKLYLNSFNMERFEAGISESEERVKGIIKADLERLLETSIELAFFDRESEEDIAFPEFEDIRNFIPEEELENVIFSHFEESPELLQSTKTNQPREYKFRTDILRSNCRVTNQPDWGDLFVHIISGCDIDLLSVISYLVSFRKENHFHEEVVEMIYKRFQDAFQPDKLMIAAMYTRRGGIDINPLRVSHNDWIDESFLSSEKRLAKTWRQ
ncbi:NADPH-dependent 7-cyano-7-deazaguanine reductase QueF [Paludibacter sp. 221]|uniref:NADPH-dependent 7-cyano-7-deazaguanine reductase QueF n=1 Tax=Paludibacter sp. 221 TaxID=2302939 RepID=UPI0013D12591|nr:NADPH-dependent 7-cyano-7-deazaguanine reductase QueF [Paludibacter sp. 221]NDV47433.1 NADPH-dependent 7-cyano-7-deazaguanine reductase QueF [Paludibacter sp. 221]